MERIPAVSVVVPMYNVENYIKICIDSILAQTFQDFEIILVDDNSSDKSFDICQKFYGGNDRVKLVRNEKNPAKYSAGSARNTGIKNARGKYIYFMDSDDFLLPYALERLYNTAERTNAQVVHVAGRYELFQDEIEPIRQENLKLMWDAYDKEGFLHNNIVKRLDENWKNGATRSLVWLCFCRRDFLAEKKIEFLKIISEDEIFCFALLYAAERYYILHDALYIYRNMRKNSVMGSKNFDKIYCAVRAGIIASEYVWNALDKMPRFDGYETWRDNLLNYKVFYGLVGHSFPYYSDLNISAQKNDFVKEALTPYFGAAEPFVRILFNNFQLYRRQSEILNQQRQLLYSQAINLFDRIDISRGKVVFNNFNGKGYGCNPKYIAEEILRQNLPYDLVWLVNDLQEPMPDRIRKVQYNSLDSVYELATAKVIVTNCKNLLPYPKKKPGQYLIMTWHGGDGFKKVEADAEEKLSAEYVNQSKMNSAMTDLMIAGTQNGFEIMSKSFWYGGEIMKCGLPRNDIFFRRNDELITRIRAALNVPAKNKLIMYAPTFRDNPATFADVYNFDAKKLLKAVEKKFGGKWTLLVRHHPNISGTDFAQNFFADAENTINVTNYPDVQELIVAADILVSDYSGVIWDFMTCGKPVFIYAKDYDTYPQERGFSRQYFELPYKVNRTEGELLNCIKSFNAKNLKSKVKRFIDAVQPFDTGHASEAVVARIKAVIV